MLRHARNLERKLARLDARERRFAAAAFLCAPLVELGLHVAGLRRTLSWVERISDVTRRDGQPLTPERAEQLIAGVYRAHLLSGQCLPRALLQYGLQRRSGAAVRFVVGVRREGQTSLDAHAWVESAQGPRRSEAYAPVLTVDAS